jgi:hypothetical protein
LIDAGYDVATIASQQMSGATDEDLGRTCH